MNKLSKRLAVAIMTCAAVGVAACQEEKKPEEKPAASTSEPAPQAANPATPPAAEAPTPPLAAEPAKPAETTPPPAAPEAEKKAEAPAAPASEMAAAPAPETPASPPAAEPAKPAEASPPTPAPAPAAEPEKSAEAPAAASHEMAAAPAPTAPPAEPEKKPEAPASESAASPPATNQTAESAPAPAAKESKPDEAKPADAAAAPAAPADIKDRTSPPDPVSELAKQQGFKFEDTRYRNKDGEPQPVVTKDYMVDWGTWNGFRRYHDACHVCHGPNALGSTFAPALKDSLKTMDYSTFVATVSSGKKEDKGGTLFVMPSFGEDRNIMCYLDDIYTYIKARSLYDNSGAQDGMPPGRPNGREDISPEARKAADDCTG